MVKNYFKHMLAIVLLTVFAALGLGSMATTDAYDLGYTLGSALVGGDSSGSSSSGSSSSAGYSSSSSSSQRILINIVNNTGNQINSLAISASGNDSWGDFYSTSLRNGGTLNLEYTYHTGSNFNIRLRDINGNTYSKYNIRIFNEIRVDFTRSDRD